MKITDEGFYLPFFENPLTKNKDKILSKICPSIYVHSKNCKGLWGNVTAVYKGWSNNKNIRFHSSSGGVVTSLCLYLIENRKVDAVLQVGNTKNNFLYNQLKISKSKEEIISNSQSRYAPAIMFDNIINILELNQDVYAFVGKPCDIQAIKNFLIQFPRYKNRIKYFIAIFCAGMPSYNATLKLLEKSGHKENPLSIKYRGDGWPGEFKAEYKDGSHLTLDYNKSWGEVLGRMLNKRCKICPDGIGINADIAVGDAWVTKNGFPDFQERPGESFILVRTKEGENIINECSHDKFISLSELKIDSLPLMQPYQTNRRKIELWRLLPIQIKTNFLLNFRGLKIVSLGFKCKPKIIFNTLKGSIKRFI